jgi:hypothetical protein
VAIDIGCLANTTIANKNALENFVRGHCFVIVSLINQMFILGRFGKFFTLCIQNGSAVQFISV